MKQEGMSRKQIQYEKLKLIVKSDWNFSGLRRTPEDAKSFARKMISFPVHEIKTNEWNFIDVIIMEYDKQNPTVPEEPSNPKEIRYCRPNKRNSKKKPEPLKDARISYPDGRNQLRIALGHEMEKQAELKLNVTVAYIAEEHLLVIANATDTTNPEEIITLRHQDGGYGYRFVLVTMGEKFKFEGPKAACENSIKEKGVVHVKLPSQIVAVHKSE